MNFLRAFVAKEKTFLKDIYLIVQNEDDEKSFLEVCMELNYKLTPRQVIHTKSGSSDPGFGKTMISKPDKEENCCICMDTPTNPKKLKCGHIFCKECIDQYFTYKPTCPICGQIYGKMTGDQPPGSITIKRGYQILEGFSDSYGCIVITYSMPDGYQGVINEFFATCVCTRIWRSFYFCNLLRDGLI